MNILPDLFEVLIFRFNLPRLVNFIKKKIGSFISKKARPPSLNHPVERDTARERQREQGGIETQRERDTEKNKEIEKKTERQR